MKELLMGAWLLIAIFGPGPALALVDLLATCDQATGEFEFTLLIVNDIVAGDPSGYRVVIEQTLAGSCNAPELAITPDFTLPPHLQEVTYNFSFGSPFPQRVWRYEALLQYPDGHLEPLGPFGNVSPVVSLSWGDAPAVRGYLESDPTGPYFRIRSCNEDCGQWLCYENIDLSKIHPEQYAPFLNSAEPVDIYGDLLASVPPGGACMFARSVTASRANPCAGVAEQSLSWGSFKSVYR